MADTPTVTMYSSKSDKTISVKNTPADIKAYEAAGWLTQPRTASPIPTVGVAAATPPIASHQETGQVDLIKQAASAIRQDEAQQTSLPAHIIEALTGTQVYKNPEATGVAAGAMLPTMALDVLNPEAGLVARAATGLLGGASGSALTRKFIGREQDPLHSLWEGTKYGPLVELGAYPFRRLLGRLATGELGHTPGGILPGDKPSEKASVDAVRDFSQGWFRRINRTPTGRAMKEAIEDIGKTTIEGLAGGEATRAEMGQEVINGVHVGAKAFQQVAKEMTDELKFQLRPHEASLLEIKQAASELYDHYDRLMKMAQPSPLGEMKGPTDTASSFLAKLGRTGVSSTELAPGAEGRSAVEGTYKSEADRIRDLNAKDQMDKWQKEHVVEGGTPPILHTMQPPAAVRALLLDILKLPDKMPVLGLWEFRKQLWEKTDEALIGRETSGVYKKFYGMLTEQIDKAIVGDPLAEAAWYNFRNEYREGVSTLNDRVFFTMLRKHPEYVADTIGRNGETAATKVVKTLIDMPERNAKLNPSPAADAAIEQGKQALRNFRNVFIQSKLSQGSGSVFNLAQQLRTVGNPALQTLFGDKEGREQLQRVRTVADMLERMELLQDSRIGPLRYMLRDVTPRITGRILSNPALYEMYVGGLRGYARALQSPAARSTLGTGAVFSELLSKSLAQIGRAWLLASEGPMPAHKQTVVPPELYIPMPQIWTDEPRETTPTQQVQPTPAPPTNPLDMLR